MQFVKCPHCLASVDVENDQCPNCGKTIFDYEYNHDDKDYDSHYSDYLSTNKDLGILHKVFTGLSVLGMLYGLYKLFFTYSNEEGPSELYWLVLISFIVFIITRVMVWLESRKAL